MRNTCKTEEGAAGVLHTGLGTPQSRVTSEVIYLNPLHLTIEPLNSLNVQIRFRCTL